MLGVENDDYDGLCVRACLCVVYSVVSSIYVIASESWLCPLRVDSASALFFSDDTFVNKLL